MSWRSIIVSQGASLTLLHKQLIVTQAESISIPLEDIGVIVLENKACTLSTPLLIAIAEANILLFVCDSRHLPCGGFLPFQQHYHQLKVFRAQIAASKVFANRCWQAVVKQKITNQALCLELAGETSGAKLLQEKVALVSSGDKQNMEATAAVLYFKILFEKCKRREENTTNAALNYGYAIMRGAMARSLVAHGLQPMLGIFHANEYNAFNLADDFMEVVRPMVDIYVYGNLQEQEELGIKDRAALVNLLHYDMLWLGKRVSVLKCIDNMAAQFAVACLQKDYQLLTLPELLPLKLHAYE